MSITGDTAKLAVRDITEQQERIARHRDFIAWLERRGHRQQAHAARNMLDKMHDQLGRLECHAGVRAQTRYEEDRDVEESLDKAMQDCPLKFKAARRQA